MKKIVSTLAVGFAINCCIAQNSNLEYSHALKVYNLSTNEEYSVSHRTGNKLGERSMKTKKDIRILHPTIAYQWKCKNNNFQEIELSHFSLGKSDVTTTFKNDSGEIKSLTEKNASFNAAISLRYEYILNFKKSKESKLVPALGFGINPYYLQNKFNPKSTTSYASNDIQFGTRLFVIPRLSYYFSSKFFVDLNIPLCIIDGNVLSDEQDNPLVSAEERKTTYFNFNGLAPIFSARIGLGIKL